MKHKGIYKDRSYSKLKVKSKAEFNLKKNTNKKIKVRNKLPEKLTYKLQLQMIHIAFTNFSELFTLCSFCYLTALN